MDNIITTGDVKPSLLTRARISKRASHQWRGRNIRHAGVVRCLQLIQHHRQTPPKLDDLQRVAGLKRRGLHKAFVTHLRCTPGVILRLMRLDCARDLLVHTNLPIAEVARRSGYRSANSLCVVFMRDLGVSPARFRSQQQS